jgi:mannose-6-phosphate isomerase-like protein (cupin superfamily)
VITFPCTEQDRRKLAELKIDPEALKEKQVDYSRAPVLKPWGEEREWNSTKHFSMWRLAINVGQQTSMHCHTTKTTVLEVQTGEVLLETFTGTRALRQGDCVLIEPGCFHRIKSPTGAVVIELEWPPNRNDLVRISDAYGREGKGYGD